MPSKSEFELQQKERAFLEACGEDLSSGYTDEDLVYWKAKRSDLYELHMNSVAVQKSVAEGSVAAVSAYPNGVLEALKSVDNVQLSRMMVALREGDLNPHPEIVMPWVKAYVAESRLPFFKADLEIRNVVLNEVSRRFMELAQSPASFTLSDEEQPGQSQITVTQEGPFILSVKSHQPEGVDFEHLVIERYNGQLQVRVYQPGSQDPDQTIQLKSASNEDRGE